MSREIIEKTFAENGTIEQLSDAQMRQGYDFLGEEPPSFGQFNFVQKQVWLGLQHLLGRSDVHAGSITGKVNKEAGKGLSSNDFSNNDKATLDSLASGTVIEPKPIDSASLAILTGIYYTSGNVPTVKQYKVDVIATDTQIIQTATKGDGVIWTRSAAAGDLATTAWESTKDSQITISDGRTQRQFNQYLDVRKAGSFYDVRDFGVIATEGVLAMTAAEVAALKDWGEEIRTILRTLKSPFTLYIPFGVKWKKTDTSNSLGTDLYDAMPDGCRIIDNSGYEDRYSSNFFQATSYEINKTYAYDEVNNTDKTGQTNGNTHNIRASYHPAYCSETDAPRYTAGCRSSIVFRLNNTKKSGGHSSNKYASDMFQLSADYTVKGQENFGFSSYGDISPGGTRIFRHGAQDSIAPTSFAFNSALVAGASFIIGKKQRDPIGELANVNWDDPADIASKKAAAVAVKDAEWRASGHVVKHSQPSGHTGSFVSMWDVNGVLWLRRDIALNGDITYTTKTGNAFKITTDAVLSGLRKNVIAPTSTTVLSATQSGSIIHNGSAAGGFVVTLPKASAGISFRFQVLNASNLRVQPNAADNFIGLAAGVFKQSSVVGAVLVITAISATQWMIETETGAWTTA